jgi:hypothetical protein
MAILDPNGTTAPKTAECIPLPDQVFTWIQHSDVDEDRSISGDSDDSSSSSETSTTGSSASTSSRSARTESDSDTETSAVLPGPGTPPHYTLEAALHITDKIENGELTRELQEDYWHHFDMCAPLLFLRVVTAGLTTPSTQGS